MADPPAKKSAKSKRPWVIAGLGTVAAVIAWRVYQARQAANATTALTGGTTIPAPSTSGPTTQSFPTSLPAWIEQALSGNTTVGYPAASLLNDINAWLSGQCVSAQGYNVIANLIETEGVPPGYQTPPSLAICPGSTLPSKPGTPPVRGLGPQPVPTTPHTMPAPSWGAGVTAGMERALDAAVGRLSAATGRGATPAQVAQIRAEAAAQGLTGEAASFFEQTQNVGIVSRGLKTPALSSISALAVQLAGGQRAYASMGSGQQNYYKELANVTLLGQLNPKAA